MVSKGKELEQSIISVAVGVALVALLFTVLWLIDKPSEPNTVVEQEPIVELHAPASNTEGKPLWLNYDGKYQLYYEGTKISGTNRVLVDEDLLVFDPQASRTFLFEDFTLLDDSTLRQAKEFERGAPPLYRVKDGKYWLYVKGEQITDVSTFQSVNDLIVTDNATGIRYRIRDFYILDDNTLRLAQII